MSRAHDNGGWCGLGVVGRRRPRMGGLEVGGVGRPNGGGVEVLQH